MEISTKTGQLVSVLLEKTRLGQIPWEATNIENVFQASFPNSSVQISERRPSRDDSVSAELDFDMVLSIHNEEGTLVEEIDDIDLRSIHQNAFKDLQELYVLARRYALGTEQVIDNILSALYKLDDIPF